MSTARRCVGGFVRVRSRPLSAVGCLLWGPSMRVSAIANGYAYTQGSTSGASEPTCDSSLGNTSALVSSVSLVYMIRDT